MLINALCRSCERSIDYFWFQFQLTKSCAQPCLEWMSTQVTRNKLASHWLLNQMESWVEPYLIANNNVRVRNGTLPYLPESLICVHPPHIICISHFSCQFACCILFGYKFKTDCLDRYHIDKCSE